MADTAIDLKTTPLTGPEVGRGYNVRVQLDWQQMVNNAPSGESNGDTQTYTITNLPIGSCVKHVQYILEEDFTAGGTEICTLELGDSDDSDGYMTVSRVGPLVPVAAAGNNGAYFNSTDTTSSEGETDDVTVTLANTTNSKIYTAANQLLARLTPSSFKLGDCTAGRLVVYADIIFP